MLETQNCASDQNCALSMRVRLEIGQGSNVTRQSGADLLVVWLASSHLIANETAWKAQLPKRCGLTTEARRAFAAVQMLSYG